MLRVKSTNSMTIPVTENDPLGALTPPNHPNSPVKGLVKSATCPNNDLYNANNDRAKTPIRSGRTPKPLCRFLQFALQYPQVIYRKY